MAIEQLIKKNCKTGAYENMLPVTVVQAIKDQDTGEGLDTTLSRINHLYLPYIGKSRMLTRRQVPQRDRRKGLWITYETGRSNVITERYLIDDFSDNAWMNRDNWEAIDPLKAKAISIEDLQAILI